MSKAKKRISGRNRRNSTQKQDFGFVDFPAGGALFYKSDKGNCLHVFDNIGFMAIDMSGKSFEIEGLVFDTERGWYDANADIPKYYGKSVYSACMDYAVDRAISDNWYLQLAIFGKKRPAESAMLISYDDLVSRLESECCSA